ncbi:MAG: Stk1 family PASTA domain-containing Ser/Thr kinase [Ktedonobacterales bacterium]|nr:Stk1 family PASTA domain-containing Ser/Thr kinase [Ktedonobacterales bacterium]
MESTKILGDRYELLDPIGRGGMATIYRARDRRMGRMVAIKILREMYSSDPKFVLRFQREARAVSALSHPNIVQVFDYGRSGDEYYIVMELIEGTDLRRYLKNNGILDIRRAVVIAHDVALALGAAHQRGIVHRDVKPQNVLVNDQALVKLTDFGIATFYRDVNSERLTTTGMTLGTVQYYAPEQAQGEVVTPAADIYALGIVMYEMLVGHPPFDGDTPVAIAVRHIQEPPARPSRYNPDIPPALERIILRCLEKDPRDRYRDGDALAYALETYDKPRSSSSGRMSAAGGAGGGRAASGPMGTGRPPSGPRGNGFGNNDFGNGPYGMAATNAEVPARTVGRMGISDPDMAEDDKPSAMSGVTIAVIVASVLLLFAVSCFLAFRLGLGGLGNNGTTTALNTTIPNFVGMTLDVAQTEAQKDHLVLRPAYHTFDPNANVGSTPPQNNTISSQSPAASLPVAYGTTVDVTVETVSQTVLVPSTSGYTVQAACAILAKSQLNCQSDPSTFQRDSTSTFDRNIVVNTVPGFNTPVKINSSVSFIVSAGAVKTATPTPSVTATPSPTPTPSVTATPTLTPTPTNTPTPIPTP